ncbi:hypothetical protein ACEPPN_009308 [Leptodophora sp. 'Broadleaf-Isolate-01']
MLAKIVKLLRCALSNTSREAAMLYSALASEPDWEFRIATLQPGGFKDQIKISLHQVRFKDKPEYEALSYVWGKPKVTESISLNGQPFNITTNLFLALRRLRHEDKRRLLWIDAICIDQSNTQERQQQVSRMKEIYSCASKVTVWMGEDDTLAICACKLVGLILHLPQNHPELAADPENANQRAREIVLSHPWYQLYGKPAQKFLANDWFRRVWTFQEAYLSRNIEVVCGETKFPWMPFVQTWNILDIMGIKLLVEGMESVRTVFATCTWAEEAPTPQNRLRLSNLLRSTYTHLATDPRDKIFGLLAMVKPRDGLNFPIDYSANVDEVFIRFSRLMIQDDGHLQILSDTQQNDRRPSIPSWVPDWDKKSQVNQLAERIRNYQQRYDINKGILPPKVETSDSDTRKLHLRGAKICTIKSLCPLDGLMRTIDPNFIDRETPLSTLSHFKKFFAELQAPHFWAPYPTPGVECPGNHHISQLPATYTNTEEPIFSAFVRTVGADFLPTSRRVGRDLEHYYPNFYAYQAMTWEQALAPEFIPEGASAHSLHAGVRGSPAQEVVDVLFNPSYSAELAFVGYDRASYAKVVYIYHAIVTEICRSIHGMAGRCLFVTDNSFLGLGPAEAAVGDGVYDLFGGDVPLVLRETKSAGDFTLMGDAYVHGIMDGELWNVDENGEGLNSIDGCLEWGDVVLV